MKLAELKAAFERGNHKSAIKEEETLEKAFAKEIDHGYQLCIMSPMGVANQITITNFGEIIKKDRVPHDMSFPGEITESINS